MCKTVIKKIENVNVHIGLSVDDLIKLLKSLDLDNAKTKLVVAATAEASPVTETNQKTVVKEKRQTGPKIDSNANREWIYDAITAGKLVARYDGSIERFDAKTQTYVPQKVKFQGRALYDKDGNLLGHSGYLCFRLTWKGVSKTVYVHDVVYMYFNGLLKLRETVDHIDMDKENNCISNLQTKSLEENAREGNLRSERAKKAKTLRKEIIIRKESGDTTEEIAKALGLSVNGVKNRLRTARKKGEYSEYF